MGILMSQNWKYTASLMKHAISSAPPSKNKEAEYNQTLDLTHSSQRNPLNDITCDLIRIIKNMGNSTDEMTQFNPEISDSLSDSF